MIDIKKRCLVLAGGMGFTNKTAAYGVNKVRSGRGCLLILLIWHKLRAFSTLQSIEMQKVHI
jgi:hypothetical protein